MGGVLCTLQPATRAAFAHEPGAKTLEEIEEKEAKKRAKDEKNGVPQSPKSVGPKRTPEQAWSKPCPSQQRAQENKEKLASRPAGTRPFNPDARFTSKSNAPDHTTQASYTSKDVSFYSRHHAGDAH